MDSNPSIFIPLDMAHFPLQYYEGNSTFQGIQACHGNNESMTHIEDQGFIIRGTQMTLKKENYFKIAQQTQRFIQIFVCEHLEEKVGRNTHPILRDL